MDWFRHDLSAQQDIKVKKLIRKYGYEGYGLYWHAVELLYNNGGTMKINDFEEEFELISQASLLGYLKEIGLIGIEGDFYTSSRIKDEIIYQQECKMKKSEAGKKGNAVRWQNNRNEIAERSQCDRNAIAMQSQIIAPTNLPTYQEITKKETPKGVKKESIAMRSQCNRKAIAKPTLQEISDYCNERLNGIDAQMFFDFYQAKGWKIGNAPMKDWKACVRTWENRNNKPLPKSKICNNAEAMRADMNATGGFDL